MKKVAAILRGVFFCVAVLVLGFQFTAPPSQSLRSGDIIFQSSTSGQSAAVQLATHSKYSHCGMIWIDKKDEAEKVMVIEAVQPVKITPLKEWVKMGDDDTYAVRRLKKADSVLTAPVLKKMKTLADSYMGKDYDLYFEWSDDKIYCSELVWKIYKSATGLEIGKLQKLKEFDLTHPLVKKKLKERYGKNIPMEETVISPGSMFNSDLLISIPVK